MLEKKCRAFVVGVLIKFISKMNIVESTLNLHIKFWKLTGVCPLNYRSLRTKLAHVIFIVIFNFTIIFYYPVSMTMELKNLLTFEGIIDNISMSATLYVITLKTIYMKFKAKDFTKICAITAELEEKFSKEPIGRRYLEIYKVTSKKYFDAYAIFYTAIIISGGLSTLTYPRDQLRYPAYFPLDLHSNKLALISVKLYQFFGWAILVYVNLFLDTYPPILIYLLKQNIKILSNRISMIGSDGRFDSHQLLREAIEDNKALIGLFQLMNAMISPKMFLMFLNVLISLVSAILLIVYFAENALQSAFFMLYAAAVLFEIVLACYYGSEFEASNEQLVRSVYSCNWTNQSKGFKRDLIIFVESSLHQRQFVAGGIFPISLITFQKVVKTSYTYYTVLSQMANKF